MAEYTNKAQQRIIKLIEIMAGNERLGLPLKEISEKLGTSTTAAFRDLKNLEEVGWAIQFDSSNWAMTSVAAKPLKSISDGVLQLMSDANRINREYLQGDIE